MEKIIALLPDWAMKKGLILENWQWFAIFLLLFFAFLIERFVQVYVGNLVNRLCEKYEIDTSKKRKKKLIRPIGLMTLAGIWISGIRLLHLPENVASPLLRIGYVLFAVSSVMTVNYLVDLISIYFEKWARNSDNKFDDILVPLVRKSIKALVITVGAVFIGDSLTIDMKSIIAGLGIGGIAFALAAKDSISNLFGSLTVLLDKPFQIGDWIKIDEKTSGIVEEVGLRSTRIRTFYDSLITVPNGMLTNVQIDNYGKRTFRRYSTHIGLQYDTPPEKIEAFCEAVRQLILKHKWTRKDYFHVYFNGFNNSSLDILVYLFWRVPDWSAELAEKHRILIDILRIGNELGVNFAFPTQTVHLFNEEQRDYKDIPTPETAHSKGHELATKLAENPITMSRPRSGTKLDQFQEDTLSL